MMTTLKPMAHWLDHPSDRLLLTTPSGSITTEQLKQDVLSLYFVIKDMPGQAVALFFKETYPFVVALLATFYAGKTPLLLGHDRIAQLQGVAYDQLLTDRDLPSSIVHCLTPPYLQTKPTSQDLPLFPEQASLILYTSGSNGQPKAIKKSVRAMDTEALWLSRLWGHYFKDKQIRASVNHQHLYGLTFKIWLSLSLGSTIDDTIIEFPEQLGCPRPYVFITSPAFLQFLDLHLPVPPWVFVLSAGGPLADALAQRVYDWSGQAVHEIYGSTETGVVAYRQRLSHDSLWTPFPDVSFDREEDRFYLHSALLDEAQPFALDDRLHFTSQGQFKLLGRVDKIIKIGENRISITQIEERLHALPEVSDVAIVPLTVHQRTYLGAVLVLNEVAPQTTLARIHHFKKQLRPYVEGVAIPRYWRFVDRIPLNQQGKRSQPQLQELFNHVAS